MLKGIDLELVKGNKYAIVGASGSGKSTMASLLCGIYTPDIGQITLDDADLQELDPLEVVRHITLVPNQA